MNKERLRKKIEALEKFKQDPRYQQVMGFLIHKGLLVANREYGFENYLNIKDALWAAKIEARIIEVLPAAILHFPKSIVDPESIPKKLQVVLENIKDGSKEGEDYKGLKYADMRKWADIPLKDKRTKPISRKKRQNNFRFRPEVLAKLEEYSKNRGLTKTEALEDLVMKWGG